MAGRRFPVAAGIRFGLGLGGFFDGIVLRQLLQWFLLWGKAMAVAGWLLVRRAPAGT